MKKYSKFNAASILVYMPAFGMILFGIIWYVIEPEIIVPAITFIIAILYYKHYSGLITKIIIDGDDVIFIRANGKEVLAKIADVASVNEVGTGRGFHEEVLVRNVGYLHIANLLIGVEVIRNGYRHRGIEVTDFPFSHHDIR